MRKILAVDDQFINLKVLRNTLEREGFQVITCDHSPLVIDLIKEEKPDLILLDIMMPNLDGHDLCRLIREDARIDFVPVIMVTAKDDPIDVKTSLEAGAFDFIRKPFDRIELLARVESALRYRDRMHQLLDLAIRDSLTGVFNRRLLMELLHKESSYHQRHSLPLSFVMLDIDFFKDINDNYGHPVGDDVLVKIAGFLSKNLRDSDWVGRYGGEEFGIILGGTLPDAAAGLCERLRNEISGLPFTANQKDFNITVSMGIAGLDPATSLEPEELLRYADQALYRAKQSGRNKVSVYQY